MKHIAIDLETMGISPMACVVAIGAVEFDVKDSEDIRPHAVLGREFYVNVDLQSCLDLGLTMDARTVYWWLDQSAEARAALADKAKGTVTITQALSMFINWFPKITWNGSGVETPDPSVCVWARGQDFDIGILRSAYALSRQKHPWAYNRARDSRTLIEAVGFDTSIIPMEGTAHNALDDAKREARAIAGAMALQMRRVYEHGLLNAKVSGRENPADEIMHHLVGGYGRLMPEHAAADLGRIRDNTPLKPQILKTVLP